MADPATLATTLRDVSRDRLTWIVAVGLAVVVGALAAAGTATSNPVAALLFAALPVAVLAGTLSLLLRHGAVLAAGALALAVTPAAQAALGAGRAWGAIAVLAACGAAVTGARTATAVPRLLMVGGGLVGVALVTIWFARTSQIAATPSWGDIVARTGSLLTSGPGTLDTASGVPTSAWLLWWVGVGVVTAAGLVGPAPRLAIVIPAATSLFLAVGWLISARRGAVDMASGLWIMTTAIAFTGAAGRIDVATARRAGVAVFVAAGLVWGISIVALARS